MEKKIAEVIAAGTTEFTAECYELYDIPPLGSLVFTFDPPLEILAVVYHATTSGIEPGRRPVARGKNEISDEDVYRANPQLTKLLRSEFQALVLGHTVNDTFLPYLPPKPARLHSFVHTCPTAKMLQVGQSLDFLSLLVNAPAPTPPEELIAATLREISRVQTDPASFLIDAGKKLTGLYTGDYRKLKAILGRLSL